MNAVYPERRAVSNIENTGWASDSADLEQESRKGIYNIVGLEIGKAFLKALNYYEVCDRYYILLKPNSIYTF